MSLAFSQSNTSLPPGIIQLIERRLGFDSGGISSNAKLLAYFTGEANLALDRAWGIGITASGTWQLDDSNYANPAGYPIVLANLVASQRDYTFTTDAGGNLILDVYKVFIADSSGVFSEIMPVDVQSGASNDAGGGASGRLSGAGGSLSSFTDGRNATGTPSRYDKTANGIFLDPIPNYNYTNGLKLYVNREASYFAVTDTTKKPGFVGLFHEYLVYRPCAQYALDKNLSNYQGFENKALQLEDAIAKHYGLREKDVRKRLQFNVEDNR